MLARSHSSSHRETSATSSVKCTRSQRSGLRMQADGLPRTRMTEYAYPGDELDLFKHATHWKSYCGSALAPHIRGRVLEVGAGIGGTGRFLCTAGVSSWTCLEPDESLASRLRQGLDERPFPVPSRVLTGTLMSVPAGDAYDTLLYSDVLEHIPDDRGELRLAATHLSPHGRIVVLSPAGQWLSSPFDEAVGHCRRYSRASLVRAAPPTLRLIRAFYLDSAGLLASLANKILLKSRMPTLGQIQFWDGYIIPISTWLDPACGHAVGKTVVAIWSR
ncbi:MAG: methyltransferase domain-containing protein [Vicinamibacterales bacterium]